MSGPLASQARAYIHRISSRDGILHVNPLGPVCARVHPDNLKVAVGGMVIPELIRAKKYFTDMLLCGATDAETTSMVSKHIQERLLPYCNAVACAAEDILAEYETLVQQMTFPVDEPFYRPGEDLEGFERRVQRVRERMTVEEHNLTMVKEAAIKTGQDCDMGVKDAACSMKKDVANLSRKRPGPPDRATKEYFLATSRMVTEISKAYGSVSRRIAGLTHIQPLHLDGCEFPSRCWVREAEKILYPTIGPEFMQ